MLCIQGVCHSNYVDVDRDMAESNHNGKPRSLCDTLLFAFIVFFDTSGIELKCSQDLCDCISAYANGWNRGKDYDENQPTSRRSLSMDSIETPHFETSLVPQSQQNSNQLPAIGGLPPLHNAAGKRSRTLTPVKEKSLSPWGSLGFTHSPGDLDFGCDVSEGVLNRLPRTDGMVNGTLATEGFNAVADMSASEMEMKRQRRLRVFQEMTLTGSPQA